MGNSSVTIKNVIAVAGEAYTWGSLYDPIRNVHYLGRFFADQGTMEQSAGRLGRLPHTDEPSGPIKGKMFFWNPPKSKTMIGEKGDCST